MLCAPTTVPTTITTASTITAATTHPTITTTSTSTATTNKNNNSLRTLILSTMGFKKTTPLNDGFCFNSLKKKFTI